MNISPKVGAAVVAAAVTSIVVWLLSLVGVIVPDGVADALTVIFVFVAGYFVVDPLRDAGEAVVVGDVVPDEDVAAEVVEGETVAGEGADLAPGTPVDVVEAQDELYEPRHDA